MSTVLTPKSRKRRPPKEDRFRFGWRYVEHKTPKGRIVARQVPLTEEDVLFPQEGDFIVNTPLHDRITVYLRLAIKSRHAHQDDVVVIGDTRVHWGSKLGWIHGPDVAMFTGVKGGWSPGRGTFYLAKTKGKAKLVIEATSPSTRRNDFGYKLRQYFRVDIPVYVIIDIPQEDEEGDLQLFGFQAGPTQYEPMPKDDKGRLWLDATGLWLGVANRMVYLEDREGNRLPEYLDLVVQHQETLKKAAAEAQARQAAEAKLRELEAKLARHSDKHK